MFPATAVLASGVTQQDKIINQIPSRPEGILKDRFTEDGRYGLFGLLLSPAGAEDVSCQGEAKQATNNEPSSSAVQTMFGTFEAWVVLELFESLRKNPG